MLIVFGSASDESSKCMSLQKTPFSPQHDLKATAHLCVHFKSVLSPESQCHSLSCAINRPSEEPTAVLVVYHCVEMGGCRQTVPSLLISAVNSNSGQKAGTQAFLQRWGLLMCGKVLTERGSGLSTAHVRWSTGQQ